MGQKCVWYTPLLKQSHLCLVKTRSTGHGRAQLQALYSSRLSDLRHRAMSSFLGARLRWGRFTAMYCSLKRKIGIVGFGGILSETNPCGDHLWITYVFSLRCDRKSTHHKGQKMRVNRPDFLDCIHRTPKHLH
jgi:hypothetical protein